MHTVKGVYVDDVEVTHPISKEKVKLHVWMNPETKMLFALDNMEVTMCNVAFDPYQSGVMIEFADTFSGLPK